MHLIRSMHDSVIELFLLKKNYYFIVVNTDDAVTTCIKPVTSHGSLLRRSTIRPRCDIKTLYCSDDHKKERR